MTLVEIVGWTANSLSFSRFFVQWIASERARRSVAPSSFWWLSLAGATCMASYSWMRGETVLLVGVSINALIYGRNLWIAAGRRSPRGLTPLNLALLGAGAAALLFLAGALRIHEDLWATPLWLLCVVLGQAIWSTRFILQWWYTERHNSSHFPRVFWVVSLCGNLLLLAYALHLRDPVYVAGFLLGPLVQVRNLILSRASNEERNSGPRRLQRATNRKDAKVVQVSTEQAPHGSITELP